MGVRDSHKNGRQHTIFSRALSIIPLCHTQCAVILTNGSFLHQVKWPLLSSTRFTHPLDTQATAALKRIPFAETIVRDGFGSMVEQAIFLDNLSNAVRVGPKQLPEVMLLLNSLNSLLPPPSSLPLVLNPPHPPSPFHPPLKDVDICSVSPSPSSQLLEVCPSSRTAASKTQHMRMLSLPPAQPATLTRNNSVLARRPLRVAACSCRD